jgi:glycine/D-amino acid oxidase-like deaminating enzyme
MQSERLRYAPQKLFIIGAGRAGVHTALAAADMKDRHGRPLFDITLLEKSAFPLSGTSVLAQRKHHGYEYASPQGIDTARDCLHGAINDRLQFPQEAFNIPAPGASDTRMKFLIAQKTHEEGILTAEKMLRSYNPVIREYERLFHQIKEIRSLSDEQAAQLLYGMPQAFCTYLPLAEDFKSVKGYPHARAGFQTQEVGWNAPAYLCGLLNKLSEKGVRVLTNHEVLPHPHDLTQAENGLWKLHCANGKSYKAHQIVRTAWEGNLDLMPPGDPVTVDKRYIMILDTRAVADLESTFTLQGGHGIMVHKINANSAMVYVSHPLAAYSGGSVKITPEMKQPFIPAEWRDPLPPAAEQAVLDRYFKLALERAPFLKGAKPVKLETGFTLNYDSSIHQRRSRQPWEDPDRPGVHNVMLTKAIYETVVGAQAACMALARLESRSPAKPVSALPFDRILELTLHNEFPIGPLCANMAQIRRFCKERDIPDICITPVSDQLLDPEGRLPKKIPKDIAAHEIFSCVHRPHISGRFPER